MSWKRGTVCDSSGKSFSWDHVLCCCLKSWPQRKLQINQVAYSGSQSSPHPLATFSFSNSTLSHTIKVATKVLIRAPSEPSKAVPGRLRTEVPLFLSTLSWGLTFSSSNTASRLLPPAQWSLRVLQLVRGRSFHYISPCEPVGLLLGTFFIASSASVPILKAFIW